MITTSLSSLSAIGVGTPTLVTARWLFGRLLVIFTWFAGLIALVVMFIAPPVLARYQQDLTFSIWESFAGNGPAWFLYALGITCVQYLPVLISQGVTRTNHARATVLALAGISLAAAALLGAGYAAEAAWYERLGMTPTLRGAHAFTTTSQLHLVVLEYWAHAMLFALAGMLTGYTYYRFNGWLATAMLPLSTILPLGIGITLLSTDTSALSATWGWGPHTATIIGVVLLLLFEVTLVFVCARVASYVPVRSKAS